MPSDHDDAAVHGQYLATLSEALADYKIPLENHGLVRKVTDAIGIAGYYGTSDYIKAVRRDGGPSLNIAYGWTNGFRSRDEALHAAGDEVEAWPSQRGTGQWGITHAVHGHPSDGARSAVHQVRDYGTSPVCFTELSASGTCLCDSD